MKYRSTRRKITLLLCCIFTAVIGFVESSSSQYIVADEDHTVEIICKTQSEAGILEWRKDGSKLTRGLISSSDPLTLTLLEVEAIDVGLYECVLISTSELDAATTEMTAASVYLYVNGQVMISPPKKTRYVNVVAEQTETLIPCRPTLPEIRLHLYARYNGTTKETDLSSHFNMSFEARKGFTVANEHLNNINGPITCKVQNDTSAIEQKFHLSFVDEVELRNDRMTGEKMQPLRLMQNDEQRQPPKQQPLFVGWDTSAFNPNQTVSNKSNVMWVLRFTAVGFNPVVRWLEPSGQVVAKAFSTQDTNTDKHALIFSEEYPNKYKVVCRLYNTSIEDLGSYELQVLNDNEVRGKISMELDMLPSVSINIKHFSKSVNSTSEELDYLICHIEANPSMSYIKTSITFQECLDGDCSSMSDIATKLNYTTVESDGLSYTDLLIPVAEGLHGDIICTAYWTQGSLKKYTTDRYFLDSTTDKSHVVLIIGSTIAAIILVLLLASLGIVVYERKQGDKKGPYHERKDVERGSVRYADLSEPMDEATEIDALINPSYQKDKFEFPRDKLVLGERIGGGHFGDVFKGFARGIKPRQVAEETEVAVKTTKNKKRKEIDVLMLELSIMSRIGNHNNVVNLLGACTENIGNGDLYVIMELCPLGSLDKILEQHRICFKGDLMAQNISLGYPTASSQTNGGYLEMSSTDNGEIALTGNTLAAGHYIFAREHGQEDNLTLGDLVKWAIHVAKGMRHISDNQFLHGDLACRNILVAGDGTAKVSDFGLGKSMYQTSVYHKKERTEVPYCWLAPECLKHGRFSIESDVWAYGVVLWEMFTLGEKPFPDIQSSGELLRCLIEGVRLPQPDCAPQGIFDIMSNCWKVERTERPSFEQIEGLVVEQFRKLNKASPTESFDSGVMVEERHGNEYLQLEVPEQTRNIENN